MEQNDSSTYYRQSCKSEPLECSVKKTLKHNFRTTKTGMENVWYQELSDDDRVIMLQFKKKKNYL